MIRNSDHMSDIKNFSLAKHNFFDNHLAEKRVDDEDEDFNEEENERMVADEFANYQLTIPF